MQLPDAPSLVTQARSLLSSRQDLAWLGTRDARLELILATSGLAFEKTSSRPPPTLTLLLREPVRLRLRDHLRANPSPGVQSLLDSISLPPQPPLLPAQSPGGQPLEATLLLAAHLLDTSAFTANVAGDMKILAQQSISDRSLRPLQPFVLSLLSLARRFEYDSLRQILGSIDTLPSLHWFSDQIRSPTEPGDLLLAATLWAGPVDRLALLPQNPARPWADLSSSISPRPRSSRAPRPTSRPRPLLPTSFPTRSLSHSPALGKTSASFSRPPFSGQLLVSHSRLLALAAEPFPAKPRSLAARPTPPANRSSRVSSRGRPRTCLASSPPPTPLSIESGRNPLLR